MRAQLNFIVIIDPADRELPVRSLILTLPTVGNAIMVIPHKRQ